jgi:amidase
MEAAGSLDTLGLIARSIDDIALFRDVLLGVTPEPLHVTNASRLRIGFCRTHLWERCEPATQRTLEACARSLAKAGAHVTDVTLPGGFERIPDAHRAISSFEFVRNRAWEIDHHWNDISEMLRNGRIRDGLACSFAQYRDARAFAESCRFALDTVFADHDALLTPAAAGEAPVGLHSTGDASFCSIWTTMHVPAMTLPLFEGPNGLPIGAQLVAKRDSDRHLFQTAAWVMRIMQ